MFKLQNKFKIINICLFIFLELFLINNNSVMAMNNNEAGTSNAPSIEEIIVNIKNKIRENASKKVNVEKEISQERNNRNNLQKIENLTKISTNLTKLINNQKEQLKIYKTLLKSLND
ncbi:SAP54-like protein, SVM family protein [Candidatus Phytoplasma solani]|uniref:SVM family protein n=1 Tax=Candidatus Phytoplasma solani TaxID=69896 RepID=UPI0032DB83DC